VVLTNGSLLYKKEVINAIKEADLVKVSIDAPDQISFEKINCPHPDIKFAFLSEGFNALLDTFQGKVWIEIMLIKGMNDSLDIAYEFKAYLKNLEKVSTSSIIEKVHLNTPVRPPESHNIMPPDRDRLIEIKKILGDEAELIKERQEDFKSKVDTKLKEEIIGLARRRPVSVKDISSSLQVNINQVIKCLKELLETKKIEYKMYKNKKYYYSL
jgi:wyosine [tRNA(Phe)-imidazoG37] synthetase (radical SAM superfamily)